MRRADTSPSAQLGTYMRTAITILELTIGSFLLIGCLAVSMDGMATTLRLVL